MEPNNPVGKKSLVIRLYLTYYLALQARIDMRHRLLVSGVVRVVNFICPSMPKLIVKLRTYSKVSK